MKTLAALLLSVAAYASTAWAQWDPTPEDTFWNLHSDMAVAAAASCEKAYFLKVLTDGGGARGMFAFEISTSVVDFDLHNAEALNREAVDLVVYTPEGTETKKLPLITLWRLVGFCDENELFDITETRARRRYEELPMLDTGVIIVYIKTPALTHHFTRSDEHCGAADLLSALQRIRRGKDPFIDTIRPAGRKSGEPGATDNPDDAQRLREDH